MQNLIAKYLDGELSEEEAVTVLEAITRDPELEAELRTYEEMLSFVAQDTPDDPPLGFTGAVMERISAGPPHPVIGLNPSREQARRPSGHALRLGLAWAAGLVVMFAIGRMTAGDAFDQGADWSAGLVLTSALPAASEDDIQMADAAPLAQRPRAIRLIYVPRDPDVVQVSIAGTFNGWNPEGIRMERAGDVWTAQLVLPPGTYEYMFVENGEEWVTDPLALQTRDDGFGRKNAVLDISI